MASSITTSLAALLVAVTTLVLVGTSQALEVVNKQSCDIVVFAPPICEPCKCPQIQCIRAPCVQPPCVCSDLCKVVPGVVIKSGGKATLALLEAIPLQFLTVEIGTVAYVVKEADLKEISPVATVVVTGKFCGTEKLDLEALVYSNPKYVGFKRICLKRGERYGT